VQVAIAVNHAGQQVPMGDLARLARRAEALGFDALLSGDHIVLPLEEQYDHPYAPDGRFGLDTRRRQGHLIESMTVLGYLAGITERIRLGTSVMVMPYRNPIVAAKEWASLDVISKGRTICGLGVGWSRWAFDALGIPFDRRGAMTDECIEVMQTLWTRERPAFDGEFFRFDGIGFLPKPVQDPLPVWIGGQSRAAARRAARFGQCWHATRATPDQIAALLPYFHECLDAHERDRAEVGVSLKRRLHFTDLGFDPGPEPFTPDEVVGTAAQVAADAIRCRELGITQLTYDFRTAEPDEQLAIVEQLAAEVLPAVRA
jgi:probable F420-dependent oxidoreductase